MSALGARGHPSEWDFEKHQFHGTLACQSASPYRLASAGPCNFAFGMRFGLSDRSYRFIFHNHGLLISSIKSGFAVPTKAIHCGRHASKRCSQVARDATPVSRRNPTEVPSSKTPIRTCPDQAEQKATAGLIRHRLFAEWWPALPLHKYRIASSGVGNPSTEKNAD
jgi:hypothetical protein